MMSIGLHCRLAGRPGRAQAIKKFIDYILDHQKVWCAKRVDIARFWKENLPIKDNKLLPSEMTKAEFISKYGNVFEHSDWIAAKTFEKILVPRLIHQQDCIN